MRKHIGDYTLFLAGLFPEYMARMRRQQRRLDSLVNDIKAGKESWSMVAGFDQFEFQHEAPLFRRLSDRFELCVFGLNLIQAGSGSARRRFVAVSRTGHELAFDLSGFRKRVTIPRYFFLPAFQ